MKEVYSFLENLNIYSKETLVVAVSYGPDSMFLLDLIRNKYKNNKIICAHVHHNHRKESDDEAALLEKYCHDNNIIFEFMKIDNYENNRFTEIEAREKRYEFFEKILIKYNSKYLFTAHHGDDLIETILMKIVRGSTIKGYSGINMLSKREKYEIVRPLLYLTKDEILEFCIQKKILYSVDKSNNSTKYTRNRYRKNILPYLKRENKNVHLRFLNFSKQLIEYDNYIEKVVSKEYDDIVTDKYIDVLKLKKKEEIIIKKVIEKYLFEIYSDNIRLINNNTMSQIIHMVESKKSNMKLSLPCGINLYKSYNKIYFDSEKEYNEYCFVLEDEVKLPNGYIIRKIDRLNNTSNYSAAFSMEDIKLPLYVRNRKDGDKIEILNLNGSKKVKDILINEKIEVLRRYNYPVLVDSEGKVIWLPGIKKSKYDKSKLKKYDIILEYIKEEKDETK